MNLTVNPELKMTIKCWGGAAYSSDFSIEHHNTSPNFTLVEQLSNSRVDIETPPILTRFLILENNAVLKQQLDA